MALLRDPRHLQIVVLIGLSAYARFGLNTEISLPQSALTLAAGVLSQLVFSRWSGIRFEPRSALISAMSIVLLLRTSSIWLPPFAAFLAITSKFLLRYRGKHIFNPSNFAIVVPLLFFSGAWLDPGQWGNGALFALLLCCVGLLVLAHCRRSDITIAFAAFFGGFLLLRAMWLGDPLVIPLHTLKSGALIIFTFFMISDPKTTPDSRAGRILFAGLVAAVGLLIRFGLYEPHGFIWSLFFLAPLVPLIDRLLPAEPFAWERAPKTFALSPSLGDNTA